MYDFAIIGGGWAGLLSAYEIMKRKKDAKIIILEKENANDIGGLLRSETVQGFTFDAGGPHILFSKNKEVLGEIVSFLGENVIEKERKSFIYFNDKYINYPFENGIYELNATERAAIGEGIIQSMLDVSKNPEWRPVTFKDWIYGFFGKPMAEKYLEPYNRKIWKTEPSDMDADWVFSPGRLPFPKLEDIVKAIAGIESVGYKEQAKFYYPKKGGILSLYNALLDRILAMGVEISMGSEVVSISKSDGSFLVNNLVQAKDVINTLPPKILVNVIKPPPPDRVVKAASELRYNQVAVVGVALKSQSPLQHAVYVPQPDVIFHRFTWMNNLVMDTPNGYSNLIAEITLPSETEIEKDKLVADTIKGLLKINIIKSNEEVLFTRLWINEFGYPVYTQGHNLNKKIFFDFLERTGIYSVGRWGSWHYWNTDKVFEAVKLMVDNMKSVQF